MMKKSRCLKEKKEKPSKKTKLPFTVDPKSLDYDNVKCNLFQKLVFKIMYGKQQDYEEQLKKIRLKIIMHLPVHVIWMR